MTEILMQKQFIVGSPTLNNECSQHWVILNLHNWLEAKRQALGFLWLFGWGGGAVRDMIEMAKKAGFEVYEPTVEVKYVPDEEDLKKCFDLGNK